MQKSPTPTQNGISGSTLKLVAVTTMLIDHIGAVIFSHYLYTDALLQIYKALRLIGRTAFPIFCFLLVEGFFHTKDRKKYSFRLALFALLSEIPFDLAISGSPYDPDNQNVFFTLWIGFLVISAIQYIKTRLSGRPIFIAICYACILLTGLEAARFLNTDYSATGVLVIVLFHELHANRTLAYLSACILLYLLNPMELAALFALPLVSIYNGTRGLSLKYVFYLFYPAHLLILWLLMQIPFV